MIAMVNANDVYLYNAATVADDVILRYAGQPLSTGFVSPPAGSWARREEAHPFPIELMQTIKAYLQLKVKAEES